MSLGNPWNPSFPLLFLRVLLSMNFTSSQCLMPFFSISKNFSPHTEKMDFTDFVEPWSFKFIHFHTFFVFVLDRFPRDMKLQLSLSSILSITETSFLKGPLWKGMRKTIISCISLPSLLLNGDTKCITSFSSFLWTIVWEKAPAATFIEWQFWLHCLSVWENKSENKSNDPIIVVFHQKG